ncbi:MAG: aminotransferase class V-fold PLP-dependent enzyme [Saprospiraceae bacterium]|nr:aminotransferase class V-fold PLP-dependent enzyme [Saprospiraceae bacterium]
MHVLQKSKAEQTDLAHDSYFENLFEKEFSRLQDGGHTYLDYTGGGIYAKSQLKAHFDLLNQNTLGNPHSVNPTSALATSFIEMSRQSVLDFFNAHDYDCIFTLNTSNAIKIVGESYPFTPNSILLLTADNHNSINGLRSFAEKAESKSLYSGLNDDLTLNTEDLNQILHSYKNQDHKLFSFPAQSNASGVKHDLGWIKLAQNNGWDVLLDASAYVPSNRLNLSIVQPDFVCLSFYKMFGYPTGIGCLLVLKSKFEKLQKKWFAGGTVKLASVKACAHYLQCNHERFEDGTLNYLSLPAIKTGLNFLQSVGMGRLQERIQDLQLFAVEMLKSLRHTSGVPIVEIYGPKDRSICGGTITMCFQNSLGEKIHFRKIEEKAAALGFSIRAGCFCNPGVDEYFHKLSADVLNDYFANHSTGDYDHLLETTGMNRGAVRISFGIASRRKDIVEFAMFVNSWKDKV